MTVSWEVYNGTQPYAISHSRTIEEPDNTIFQAIRTVIYDVLGKLRLLQEVYRHDEHIIAYHKHIGNHLPHCNCSEIPTDSENILNPSIWYKYSPLSSKKGWASDSLRDDNDWCFDQ